MVSPVDRVWMTAKTSERILCRSVTLLLPALRSREKIKGTVVMGALAVLLDRSMTPRGCGGEAWQPAVHSSLQSCRT